MSGDTQFQINKAFLRLRKRAESSDRSKLVDTFVDVGPLITLISNPEHQILYGRRGTGKTHALLYVAENLYETGDVPIYADLRRVGSTGGIYSDYSIPVPERATRLLSDTLGALHDGILEFVIEHAVEKISHLSPLLDELAEAITEVEVVGEAEAEEIKSRGRNTTNRSSSSLELGTSGAKAALDSIEEASESLNRGWRLKRSGAIRHRVHFGRVGKAIEKITGALKPRTIWLLLDEWSSVPIDLQPYLADLLRRSLFPLQHVVVKIAAIEQRTHFRIAGKKGDYVGIELGADAAADLDLDDYMVFDNDEDRATRFFKELVFKHFESVAENDDGALPSDADDLVRAAFTQINTFQEFVRAAEGVPRDAIYILAQAAQKDMSAPIFMERVRSAAKDWYQRDKEDAVSANEEARALLYWIIDQVIGHRQARAFLLESNTRHELIDTLYDARVLHLLKKNVSSREHRGVRFDVYKLDYGCYVDLLTTTRAPQGMLFKEDGQDYKVDVPKDDYRAIRRAVLDLDEFEKDVRIDKVGEQAGASS